VDKNISALLSMQGLTVLFITVIIMVGVVVILGIINSRRVSKMTPEERQKWDEEVNNELEKRKILAYELKFGKISPEYICPHCQTKGHVRTMSVERKQGISGAKATGALLTAGVSILATGLSRKEDMTQAHCGNCDSTWHF